MGTRNLTVVVLNGEYKVAQYGQWDGYPTGQGATICQFIQSADMDEFKRIVKDCTFATHEEIKQTCNRISESGNAEDESQGCCIWNVQSVFAVKFQYLHCQILEVRQ